MFLPPDEGTILPDEDRVINCTFYKRQDHQLKRAQSFFCVPPWKEGQSDQKPAVAFCISQKPSSLRTPPPVAASSLVQLLQHVLDGFENSPEKLQEAMQGTQAQEPRYFVLSQHFSDKVLDGGEKAAFNGLAWKSLSAIWPQGFPDGCFEEANFQARTPDALLALECFEGMRKEMQQPKKNQEAAHHSEIREKLMSVGYIGLPEEDVYDLLKHFVGGGAASAQSWASFKKLLGVEGAVAE